MENISDRELELFLQGNNAAKWFCGFILVEKTPNYSVFSRARCLVHSNNGIYYQDSDKGRKALWDKYYTSAPQQQRKLIERYKIVRC